MKIYNMIIIWNWRNCSLKFSEKTPIQWLGKDEIEVEIEVEIQKKQIFKQIEQAFNNRIAQPETWNLKLLPLPHNPYQQFLQ